MEIRYEQKAGHSPRIRGEGRAPRRDKRSDGLIDIQEEAASARRERSGVQEEEIRSSDLET
jgi:hypothetical protein